MNIYGCSVLISQPHSGAEFVDWLLATFSDIDTRADALDYATRLLEQGFFKRVNTAQDALSTTSGFVEWVYAIDSRSLAWYSRAFA